MHRSFWRDGWEVGTNDMAQTPVPEGRWYCSFHGGEGGHAWNNLHAFSAAGEPLGTVLESHGLPHGIELRELRGFAFGPDGHLYVANAFKDQSQILQFGGEPDRQGRHPFQAVFSEHHHTNPGLAHPFHVAFGPDGHLYVPSQDTDVVGRYCGPRSDHGQPGAPMPVSPALDGWPAGTFHPGTFVPSARHVEGGLKAVRHVLFGADGRLYVADRAAGAVNAYDAETGRAVQSYRSRHLRTPVHLLTWPERGLLLVGDRDAGTVVALDPTSGDMTPRVAARAGGLETPAGLAWGPEGLLYVADRTGRRVIRFDPATGQPVAPPLLEHLPDEPEFILWVGPDQPGENAVAEA